MTPSTDPTVQVTHLQGVPCMFRGAVQVNGREKPQMRCPWLLLNKASLTSEGHARAHQAPGCILHEPRDAGQSHLLLLHRLLLRGSSLGCRRLQLRNQFKLVKGVCPLKLHSSQAGLLLDGVILQIKQTRL